MITRISKKQQYLNGLEHDLTYYNESIQGGKTFWHHGERVGMLRAKREVDYLIKEIELVKSDRNYKPWKTIPGF